jgi:hypothetical protein
MKKITFLSIAFTFLRCGYSADHQELKMAVEDFDVTTRATTTNTTMNCPSAMTV